MRKNSGLLIFWLVVIGSATGSFLLLSMFRAAPPTVVVLPIAQEDTRSISAGRYYYSIDYGVKDECASDSENTGKAAFVCLDHKTFSWTLPQNCKVFVRGRCTYTHFTAGVERYFILKSRKKEFASRIENKPKSIKLALSASGEAKIKDLLIDGHAWR